ncbi:MAG: DUF4349 domain-containing protein [Eubacteriales bacterium]|nr:DUF4349 domain-containing protein [Eubacteriales bacterium]
MKKLFAVLLALMMVLSLAACGAKSASNDSAAAGEGYGYSDGIGQEQEAPAEYWSSDSAVTASNAKKDTKMIYRANFDMQTLDFDKAMADITVLVEKTGGYFENKSISSYSASYRSANLTVRVPAEKYENFCNQVGELCHVTWSDSSAENITQTYYDTQSRLETAQIKLDRLQELLNKATSMEDIITIESAISDTEYEIEGLSGTLRSYDALVSYSTVYLNLSEVYRLSGTEDAPKTFGEKLANAFTEGIREAGETLEGITLWLLYNWLSLLIWAAILVAVVTLVRRVRKGVKLPKLGKKKTAAAPAEETNKTEE